MARPAGRLCPGNRPAAAAGARRQRTAGGAGRGCARNAGRVAGGDGMTPRAAEKAGFLRRAGWGAAERGHLAGDASARSYERLRLGDRTAVLMDSPPGPADDTADFLRIGAHLAGLGLSPPQVLEAEPERGLLLLEDLGDALFTAVLADDPALEPLLYAAAVDVLLALQEAPPPGHL